jgi:hypothetical protein
MGKEIDFLQNRDKDALTEFLTKRYIEEFLNGVIGEPHPISNRVALYANFPEAGSHLKTPRIGYTHHGIYVGNGKVVHYAGLADGFSSAPVEETTIEKFLNGKSYSVVPHPYARYSKDEVVKRAYSRIGENDYNLIWNNCEHFANWCIEGVESSQQVGAVLKTTAHTALKIAGKSNLATSTATAAVYTAQHLKAYFNGEITKEKLFEEINHTAITTLSTVYYSGLGQAVIPIPVVGALVGATVGFFIGDMLHRTGLIALGDSHAVKMAKERRRKIERMAEVLIPAIRKSRQEFEAYVDRYFAHRKAIFEEAFRDLDTSIKTNDNELFLSSLEKINNMYGKSLGIDSIEDLIKSGKPPKFF